MNILVHFRRMIGSGVECYAGAMLPKLSYNSRTSDMNRGIVGLLLLLLATGKATACSCWGAEGFAREDSPVAKKVFASPELVLVHARVSKVHPDHSADIEILETFQGQAPRVLIPLSAPNNTCSTSLAIGEERVFLTKTGIVNLCGKMDPTPQLIQFLRKQRKGQ